MVETLEKSPKENAIETGKNSGDLLRVAGDELAHGVASAENAFVDTPTFYPEAATFASPVAPLNSPGLADASDHHPHGEPRAGPGTFGGYAAMGNAKGLWEGRES